jgi:hypothetical protein
MPAYCQRSGTIEAIRRSSVHRSIATPSSRAAMERARNSILSDPYESLDLLRKLIQEDITKKVGHVMQEFVKDYFGPAVENMKQNLLGGDSQNKTNEPSYCSHHWLENVCCDALEHAKLAFKNLNSFKPIGVDNNNCSENTNIHNVKIIKQECEEVSNNVARACKRKLEQYSAGTSSSSTSVENAPPIKRKNSKKHNFADSSISTNSTIVRAAVSNSIDNAGDTILITKQGKPVRREGPKWNPGRLKAEETLFVLGSRANKALGLGGPGRARLYTKHPDLFKYSIKDRDEKEWLARQSGLFHAGSSVGGKSCYVMVLQDILELASTDEYASHPRRRHGELVNAGFHAPHFMVEKMKKVMTQIATDPETSDEQLLEKAAFEIQSSVAEDSSNSINEKTSQDDSNEITASQDENVSSKNRRSASKRRISNSNRVEEIRRDKYEVGAHRVGITDNAILKNEPDEMVLIDEIKIEDDNITQDTQENDSLVDTGSVEEDDLGSLLHGVNLNSLVREFEMEAACVAAAAAAAEAVGGDCGGVVGDVSDGVCDEEVSNLGGFLALAEDCEQVASNSRDVESNE